MALANTEPTKDVQVVGIGATKTGYVIRFRDAQLAETTQENSAWLEELRNDIKLVKPRFDREKKEGIAKITEENDLAEKGFKIEDIVWLKKKDRPLERLASIGVWFNTLEKFGHLAWLCKEQVKCSHCSSQHEQRYYPPGIRLRILEMPNTSEPKRIPIMTTTLHLLQLNIWKSRAGMEALINDHQSQSLDLLLIQELSITTYCTHVNHSAWQLYQSTYPNTESTRFRSLLYVNKRILTSSHQQIHCNHPDLVAIKIWTAAIQFLVFSVYIPLLDVHEAANITAAESALEEIKTTIEQHTRETDKTT
ncbi:hypothetical protein TSTA_110080 [Talaromyces stipitatus ATCC 10500]|uniref:Endonuclease/exonuclease/phosphatase domain-containing protein n=1 Tax=Talaromyces stipitatus (strain ATCC 10500 / CBS 375.48 / QM 6759 / NRRL 1006) TaxID=441959 RepID=B8MUY7_TALSN|nr:uncharacterized protein TSTA_110080 [Talaromyces stipitatus ATCC 10500]EED11828.1 hypothetical protein TSTA_110080 [Talaromyces stipitatus ATCC 10500]